MNNPVYVVHLLVCIINYERRAVDTSKYISKYCATLIQVKNIEQQRRKSLLLRTTEHNVYHLWFHSLKTLQCAPKRAIVTWKLQYPGTWHGSDKCLSNTCHSGDMDSTLIFSKRVICGAKIIFEQNFHHVFQFYHVSIKVAALHTHSLNYHTH